MHVLNGLLIEKKAMTALSRIHLGLRQSRERQWINNFLSILGILITREESRVRSLMLLCLSSGSLLFKPRPILLGKLPIVIDAAL
jgi:hypothetical protein